VQLNSSELLNRVNQEIEIFVEGIKNAECNKISLEFFTRKKRSWPLNFQFENIPWEIWTIKFDVMELSNENGNKLIQIGFTFQLECSRF
jgi:autophagy-related protein 101